MRFYFFVFVAFQFATCAFAGHFLPTTPIVTALIGARPRIDDSKVQERLETQFDLQWADTATRHEALRNNEAARAKETEQLWEIFDREADTIFENLDCVFKIFPTDPLAKARFEHTDTGNLKVDGSRLNTNMFISNLHPKVLSPAYPSKEMGEARGINGTKPQLDSRVTRAYTGDDDKLRNSERIEEVKLVPIGSGDYHIVKEVTQVDSDRTSHIVYQMVCTDRFEKHR